MANNRNKQLYPRRRVLGPAGNQNLLIEDSDEDDDDPPLQRPANRPGRPPRLPSLRGPFIPVPRQEPNRPIIEDPEVLEQVRDDLGEFPQGNVDVAPPEDTLRPVIPIPRTVDDAARVMARYPHRMNARTMVVRFRYRSLASDGRTRIWRTARVFLNAPPAADMENMDDLPSWITNQILDAYAETPDMFAALSSRSIDPATGLTPSDSAGPLSARDIIIDGRSFLLDQVDLRRAVAQSSSSINLRQHRADYLAYTHHAPSRRASLQVARNRRMYGVDDPHRSFRYMIEGCDMKNLFPILPEDKKRHEHHVDGGEACDNMCAYRMLGHLNLIPGTDRPRKVFQPEAINQWLNDNGYAVGGLQDGLTSDHIQAHAVEFRYGHCAMDLARSVLNLYIPQERDTNKKTACYVVVGNHCQPIIDSNVIKSIMKTANSRVGRRQHVGYGGALSGSSDCQSTSAHQALHQRKRARSLDRILRPQFEKSEDRQFDEQLQTQLQECMDWEQEDWEEEDAAVHTDHSLPAACLDGTGAGGDGAQAPRKRFQLPLASDDTRFHYFLSTDLDLIRERCKPTYREGQDPTLIHYYICTDKEDVEFLYQYLVRVLNIDPLRYARTFNGDCKQIRMQNTWWCASTNIVQLRKLHMVMHPQEPFRLSGLAGYAFRMFQQEAFKQSRHTSALWECMSQYPPNLQRLMDNLHPYNRPKLILRNFKPPYSKPGLNLKLHQTDLKETTNDESFSSRKEEEDNNHNNINVVQTLIPYSCRRRVDIIRSYASTIHNQTEQYPIHDITNTLVPFHSPTHDAIPVGTYMVRIPDFNHKAEKEEEDKEDDFLTPILRQQWQLLAPCLPSGSVRMMSHAMVKKLLDRNLIQKDRHILYVCATDPTRQQMYGPLLLNSLKEVVRKIYTCPTLKDICPKHLVNHLVGLFNGTNVPHSGMRFVFDNVEHLYNLLGSIVGEDQWKRFRVLHNMGFDADWQKNYEYYELDTSGMAYRSFHFQPVYNMVLEDQAMLIFDIAKGIPFPRLIQIKADAIEYEIDHDHASKQPEWVKQLAKNTIPKAEYDTLQPQEIFDKNYMGRIKEEEPKGPQDAAMYHWKFTANHANQPWARLRDSRHIDRPGTEPNDEFPEADPQKRITQDFYIQWKQEHLRVLKPSSSEAGSTDLLVDQLIGDFFATDKDFSGLLVTGPAGTGKTYLIRAIHQAAHGLNLKVIKAAYTHAACVQMGFDAVTLNSLFTLDNKSDTRAILAQSRRLAAHLRHIDVDILIVDEISMIPLGLLEIMYTFHTLSPRTRFVLVGDFNQLPPVEPRIRRDENWNYFDATDIYPALVFDRVANIHGRWLQLTQCRRTTDRLLTQIVQNPQGVVDLDITQFPPPSAGIPVWRFISWRNSTRKAVNYYCMHRYLQWYPLNTQIELCLRDLYAQKKCKDPRVFTNKRGRTNENEQQTPPVDQYAHWYQQYDKWYKPSHWKYLQGTFTYAVGMEVVCRNTIKPWTAGGTQSSSTQQQLRPECVNNRRGVIQDIDLIAESITVRWNDVIRRLQQRVNDENDNNDDNVPRNNNIDAEDVVLTYYDFAYNFVPGFCITAHMAQGETIDEHFAVMEWSEMRSMPRMAYVAVTRGRSSEFLHILDWYHEPWNVHGDTSDFDNNLLKRLFQLYRWEKESQNYELSYDEIKKYILARPFCDRCNVPLKFTKYSYSDPAQFNVYAKNSEPLNAANLQVVCRTCHADPTHRFPVSSHAADPTATLSITTTIPDQA